MIGVDLRITDPLFKNQWDGLIRKLKTLNFSRFENEYNRPYQVSFEDLVKNSAFSGSNLQHHPDHMNCHTGANSSGPNAAEDFMVFVIRE